MFPLPGTPFLFIFEDHHHYIHFCFILCIKVEWSSWRACKDAQRNTKKCQKREVEPTSKVLQIRFISITYFLSYWKRKQQTFLKNGSIFLLWTMWYYWAGEFIEATYLLCHLFRAEFRKRFLIRPTRTCLPIEIADSCWIVFQLDLISFWYFKVKKLFAVGDSMRKPLNCSNGKNNTETANCTTNNFNKHSIKKNLRKRQEMRLVNSNKRLANR